MNHVTIQAQMLPGKKSEPYRKLPEHLVGDLRRVKKNFEILDATDSWLYKMVRAHIYISGNRKEDITPEMEANFEEWCKEIAAHKEKEEAEGKRP